MHTLIIKDSLVVYVDPQSFAKAGTWCSGCFDPTTRTDNAQSVRVDSLPDFFMPGRWLWEGGKLRMTESYAEEVFPQIKAAKLAQIDAETSAAILAGFQYEVGGIAYRFSYDAFDQQNFADTANVCTLKLQGVTGLPEAVTWNAYTLPEEELVRLTFDAPAFLALYTGGALVHKNMAMQKGGERKAVVEAATTLGEVEAA